MCVPCFKFVRLGLTSFQQKEKGKVIEFIFYCVLLLLLPSIICPKHNNVALPIKTYTDNGMLMHAQWRKNVVCCRQWSARVHFSSCCCPPSDNREFLIDLRMRTTSTRFDLKFFFSLILEKYSAKKASLYYFSPEKRRFSSFPVAI